MPHLVVWDTGVTQRDLGLVPARLERDCHHGFDTPGSFGHPRVLHLIRAFDPHEAPEMRPRSSFVLHRQIEKAVHDRVHNYAVCTEPWPPGTLRIDPNVEHFIDRRGNRAANGYIDKLHYDFSCFAAKNPSSRSRRAFQKRSYLEIQRATPRRGSADNSSLFSRPCRVRCTNPARSSTLTCLQTSVSDMGNSAATSEMRAGPRASRLMMARRVGSEIAAMT